jgi:hypothetical protein
MKTKVFLMICLLMGLGLSQASAQTRNVKMEGTVPGGYFIPVFCDGTLVDYLTGDFSYKVEIHFVDGIPIWQLGQVKGQVASSSGELFSLKETDKKHGLLGDDMTLNYNLKGNRGSHYIGTLVWDWVNDPNLENPIVEKAICN